MKYYIVTQLDAGLRERLRAAGVAFHDWNNDIILDQPNLAKLLRVLDAQAVEKATDHPELVEVSLRFNRVVNEEAARNRRNRMNDNRQEYITLAGAGIADSVSKSAALNAERKKATVKSLNAFLAAARKHALVSDKSSAATRSKRFQEEYARILELPKVLAVRVCGGSLYVYTEALQAQDPVSRQRYEIGKFLIVIRLKPDNKTFSPVQWFNLSRQVDGILKQMQAPYVTADGVCCATDAVESFTELTATFELAVVVDLAIQFIETVYQDEAGQYVSKWPVATNTGVTR